MSPPHHLTGPASPADLPAAFALLFAQLDPPSQAERVRHALALVERGELDPAGVFVARQGAEVVGSLVCATVAGAGSLIWPPAAPTPRCEDELIRLGCAWLRGRGVGLTQCLLDADREALAESLLRNGFTHVTYLTYLSHDLDLPLGLLATPSRLTFEPFDRRPALFAEVLKRTYHHTLDCPEVEGARSVEEVLEGHRAQGELGSRHWWLASLGRTVVGVLVLADGAEGGEWELAYMGVVPEARRRGAGREMLLHALCEARAAGAAGLTLSVDERNAPAWQLYLRAGMRDRERRAVFLVVWRRGPARS